MARGDKVVKGPSVPSEPDERDLRSDDTDRGAVRDFLDMVIDDEPVADDGASEEGIAGT